GAQKGPRRRSATPHAKGGPRRKELRLPASRRYAVQVPSRGATIYENTKPLGEYLRDVMKNNGACFRVFGPDETASNRLQAIYEASKKTWMAEMLPEDADGGELAHDGGGIEVLSESSLLRWWGGFQITRRDGYLLTYVCV